MQHGEKFKEGVKTWDRKPLIKGLELIRNKSQNKKEFGE